MIKNHSVHLQNFPDVSFLKDEESLMKDMDLVRSICSTSLFIRDQRNLRVRLPLNKLTIIGKNIASIKNFVDIISDEVNVKSVEINEDIDAVAELKLQINFKKIGAKYSAKVKEIMDAVKNNKWQKTSQNQVVIDIESGKINLIEDEFELKLSCKENLNKDLAISVLPGNGCLVILDTKITKELQREGIARDIVRAIQQSRKDANLDMSDNIYLKVSSSSSEILTVLKDFENYIKDQTLSVTLEAFIQEAGGILNTKSSQFYFESVIDDGDLFIGLSLQK